MAPFRSSKPPAARRALALSRCESAKARDSSDLLKRLSALPRKSNETSASSPRGGGGASKRRGGPSCTALPDLGPDLLARIFQRLGPDPKDLVPLGAVCREWRDVLRNATWKELCLEHAGGLVRELGFGGGNGRPGDAPPGGWLGLYKLVVYCPGFSFPSFEAVLALAERNGYQWVEGLGHLESAPGGFHRGGGLQENLGLAARFARDDIWISPSCYHKRERGSGPPLGACRGVVKSFGSSELAKASGAAAYLQQGNILGGNNAEDGKTKPPCPFCGAFLFTLPDSCFPGAYAHGYRALCRDYRKIEEDRSDSEGEDVKLHRTMVTGSVCLNGHLLMGIAGEVPRLAGDVVSTSGEKLQLARCDTVKYLTRCIDQTLELDTADWQEFVESDLQLDQLVITAARLDKLCDAWPCRESNACVRYRICSRYYRRRDDARKDEMSALDLLDSGLSKSLREKVHGYILRGEPSLSQCMERILKAVEKYEQIELKERREEVMEALANAGFRRNRIPHPESVKQYLEDPGSIHVWNVVRQQRAAQERSEGA